MPRQREPHHLRPHAAQGSTGQYRLRVSRGRLSALGTDQAARLVGYAPKTGVDSTKAVFGRYCSNFSRRPSPGKTCLSLTSRAVSSKATETPFPR